MKNNTQFCVENVKKCWLLSIKEPPPLNSIHPPSPIWQPKLFGILSSKAGGEPNFRKRAEQNMPNFASVFYITNVDLQDKVCVCSEHRQIFRRRLMCKICTNLAKDGPNEIRSYILKNLLVKSICYAAARILRIRLIHPKIIFRKIKLHKHI